MELFIENIGKYIFDTAALRNIQLDTGIITNYVFKIIVMNKKYKLKLKEVHLTNWKKAQVRNLKFRLTTGFRNGTRKKY